MSGTKLMRMGRLEKFIQRMERRLEIMKEMDNEIPAYNPVWEGNKKGYERAIQELKEEFMKVEE